MIQTMTIHQVWDSSSSVHKMEFERKPLLNDISLVIPTLGRPILEQCLYWILVGSTWPACLIVVEQGSNTDVAGWLERVRHIGIPVNHILSTQRGRSAGINRGLEQAETRFIAITDDDCFVDQNWLLNMTNQLRLNPESVITGRVDAAGESMIVVVTSTTSSVQSRPRLKFDSMSGGNMGASLAVFRKVGLFEEDSMMATAEDAEWSYRALRRGISIRYDPDVAVVHFGWRDREKRDEQYRDYALSHGGFYGKYLRRGDLFILTRAAGHYGRALGWWLRGALKGDTELAMFGKAYCLNLLPGIGAGMRSKMPPRELK
jgi:cellulose synthase/poly-beta-1,6-N-acetylglucosamine synthase-like glycosyltransferase